MDNRFGLKTHCIEAIIKVLSLHKEVEEALIFGSRAMGTYKNGSDIDLALKGKDINFDTIAAIRLHLAELPYIYMYDIIDYKKISNPALTAHIDELGISFFKKEEINKEWKIFKLGELIEKITKGTTPSTLGGGFTESGINFIKSEAVSYEGRIDKSTFVFISKETNEKLKRSQLQEGDILFSMAGIFLGKNAIVTKEILPANTNQALAIIRIKNEFTTPKFVHYYLRLPDVIKKINSVSGQSAQPNINFEEIKSIEISLPNLTTQSQIAQILTALDDKIELNLQMNQTLEAMAQAIFKEWCWTDDEVVPEGWTWKKLLDIVDVSSSKRIFREEYILNGVPFYRGKEVTQLSNGEAVSNELFISKDRYSEIKEKFGVPKIGDILITSVGTIGSVWLVDNDLPFYFKDGNVTWIKDYKTEINGEFVYQWLQTKEAKEQIKSVTIGSTQQALTISALRNLDILIPDIETVAKICSQLEKINAKRLTNSTQNQTLTATRDTLLPKLMSGKIGIKR